MMIRPVLIALFLACPFPLEALAQTEIEPNSEILIPAAEEPQSIRGRVLDSRGEPIQGATVAGRMFGEGADANGPKVQSESPTNANGDFEIVDAPRGSYRLKANAPGFAEFVQPVEAGDSNVVFQLEPLTSLSGWVVDSRTGTAIESFRVGAIEREVGSATVRFKALGGMAVSDPEGAFRLDGTPIESFTVWAAAEGYAIGTASVRDIRPGSHYADVVIALEEEATVEGYVRTETGKPVEGAEILLGPRPVPEFVREGSSLAVSDSRGWYSAPLDALTVSALCTDHPLYPSATMTIEPVAGGKHRVDFTLSQGATLAGYVRIGDSPAAADISVWYDDRRDYPTVETDGSGFYRLTGLGPGSVRIRASTTQPERRMEERAILENGRTTTVHFSFPPGGASVGGMVSNAGEPASGVSVRVFVDTGERLETFETTSDADGRYGLDELPAGHARIQFLKPGVQHSSGVERWSTVELAAGAIETVDAELGGGTMLRVVVHGMPAEYEDSAMLFTGDTNLEDLNPSDMEQWEAIYACCAASEPASDFDGDGAYEFSGLLPGEYVVAVSGMDESADTLEGMLASMRWAFKRVVVEREPVEVLLQVD